MNEIQSVAIVGCGLMGTGIAEVCALSGFVTTAIRATGGDAAEPRKKVLASLDRAVQKGKLDPDARERAASLLSFTTDLGAAASADLVIESAAENLSAKRSLFADLEGIVGERAILASNTSSLRLTSIADGLAHPERVIGLHFFSPAQVMKLVEIGPTRKTLASVTDACRAFCTKIGKTPVELGDEPGYVVNRLLVPYMLHAIETLEAGVASPEAIDTAMKLGCGHPMGPLALADLIGLDVVFAMARSLSQELRDTRFRAPSLLRRLVLSNQLGRKTKRGFYDYAGSEPVPNPAIFAFETPKPQVAG
jgi:3-hydroxybutyryl-CoA dehydrogenase